MEFMVLWEDDGGDDGDGNGDDDGDDDVFMVMAIKGFRDLCVRFA